MHRYGGRRRRRRRRREVWLLHWRGKVVIEASGLPRRLGTYTPSERRLILCIEAKLFVFCSS